jgi:sulfide:quinone oxidoreductase
MTMPTVANNSTESSTMPAPRALVALKAESVPVTEQRRVVVLGGGVAGLTAAYELRRKLAKEVTVLLISDNDTFNLGPALLDVPFGKKGARIGFSIAPALAKHHIEFLQASVNNIDPVRRMVSAGGKDIGYDYLLIATGPAASTVAVPGVGGEFNATHSILSESAATETAQALEDFIKHPGPAVVGLATGAAYLSAAYEFALRLDYLLRRNGVRDQATITFVTPEAHLGQLGVGTPRAQQLMERLFARREIIAVTGMDIARVDNEQVYLRGGRTLSACFSMVLPRFHGASDIWKSDGVTNKYGFVPVDAHYRHTTFPEIFAAGVAAQADIPTPLLGGLPKTGYLAAAGAKIAARNLAAAVTSSRPSNRSLPKMLDLRIITGGDTGILLLSGSFIRPFQKAVRLPGRSAPLIRQALTRYVLWKLRTGRTSLP